MAMLSLSFQDLVFFLLFPLLLLVSIIKNSIPLRISRITGVNNEYKEVSEIPEYYENFLLKKYNGAEIDLLSSHVRDYLNVEEYFDEKIGMLAGNNVKTVSSILNAVSHGKWVYNYTPWTAGGVKRLGIPAMAFLISSASFSLINSL